MKTKIIKKIALSSLSVFALLVVVLCVHIYFVTRPKAPDAHTIVMARVDFKQHLDQNDAEKITQWLYAQPGVDHVLCNTQSGIAIFTFFPVRNSANNIISGLLAATNYKGVRYMPSEEDMKAGCPVASNSISYKAYSFVKRLF